MSRGCYYRLVFHSWFSINGTVISAREREREKRQGMKLTWGPIYFQGVLKACGFFTKFNPSTVEGIKCKVGHFFLSKIKMFAFKNDRKLITDFSIYECLHLTGPKVNFMFNVWEELFCLVRLHICPDVPCCIRFNWNGHRGMLPRAALRGKLVQSTGGTDCTRAAVEFRPLWLSITVNSSC